ncbi:hypothetical protein ACFL6C_06425 [Myxococcota bacterium]
MRFATHTLIGGLTLLVSGIPANGAAQPNETEREAEMFGEVEREADSEAEIHALPGTGAEGDDASDLEARFEKGLSEHEDWLDLGGLLYMRVDYHAEEDTKAQESPLRSPNLVDVYLDAQPNDRVRGHVRGRLRHDFTVPPDSLDAFGQPRARTEVLLDQLWLKLDVAQLLFVTAGKQAVRWGSGRFWNPTDFLNRQKRDPLAIMDERTGVSMVKLHLPIESLGWNLYAVANLDEAETPELTGAALRAELLFGETEIALTYASRKNNPHQLGLDISSAIWLFDLRTEVAAQKGIVTPFFRGPLDIQRLAFPREVSREDQWILQGTAALEITIRYADQDNVTVGVEYFYNDAGYKNAHLYPWLALEGQFVPLYLGRHYVAAYAHLPQPGLWNDTSFTVSAMGNLSDESWLARFDWQVRVLTHLDVNVYAIYHFGENGELNYGLSVPAFPVAGLEDGIEVRQPIIDVGVALRVAI